MNQTAKDRAWKLFEVAFYIALASFGRYRLEVVPRLARPLRGRPSGGYHFPASLGCRASFRPEERLMGL